MAYTKTPLNSTDQNAQIPLLPQWTSRDAPNLKDIKNTNVIWEITNGPNGPESAVAIKRDGFTQVLSLAGPVYLVHWFTLDSNLYLFGAFGMLVYNPNTWALVASDNSISFTRVMGSVEFQYENGSVNLIVTDGSNLVRVVGFVLTPITDPDRPTIHKPFPVYLDGYLFLADLKGNICNSSLNDPTNWSASDFIAVDAYPDGLQAIARHGVYIVAFGTASIQFYYDAANPTGTPLAVYSASIPQIGFRGGLASFGDYLMFTGAPNNGPPSVFKLDGFKVEDVGNAAVSRKLQAFDITNATFNRTGHSLLLNGHRVYTWTDDVYTGTGPKPQPAPYNLAIDVDTGEWINLEWQVSGTFPAYSSCRVENSTGYSTIMVMIPGTGYDGAVFKSDTNTYQDNGVNFSMQFVTKNYNFGSQRIKFGTRLLVGADQASSDTFVQISWSDDDYRTFNVPRQVNLANKYTQLYSLGSFRRRAHRVTYSDNFPMRFTSLEMDFGIGQA